MIMPNNPSSATVSSKLICMIKKGISLFIIRILVYELLCYRFTIGSYCFSLRHQKCRTLKEWPDGLSVIVDFTTLLEFQKSPFYRRPPAP